MLEFLLMILSARLGLFDSKLHQFLSEAGQKIVFFTKTLKFFQDGASSNLFNYSHAIKKPQWLKVSYILLANI